MGHKRSELAETKVAATVVVGSFSALKVRFGTLYCSTFASTKIFSSIHFSFDVRTMVISASVRPFRNLDN